MIYPGTGKGTDRSVPSCSVARAARLTLLGTFLLFFLDRGADREEHPKRHQADADDIDHDEQRDPPREHFGSLTDDLVDLQAGRRHLVILRLCVRIEDIFGALMDILLRGR